MINRRQMMLAGLSAGAALYAPRAAAANKAKIAIIGGGYGGATAATSLARLLPGAEITLIAGEGDYFSCPFSNLLLTGEGDIASQTFTRDFGAYENLRLVPAFASGVSDTSGVQLEDGSSIAFDRLILSPGIAFRNGTIVGYDAAARTAMPAAWGSASELRALRQQLREMDDGGTVVMSVPDGPYRCPPGPYERASLIAHYLKTHKPRSKLLVLDAKDQFSKMALFQQAWDVHYPDHLEWRGASEDGRVIRVDASAGTVHTDFEDIKADVANIIPHQRAADIASLSGVADATGWCPINGLSFESTLREHVYVIGDASIANPMPKSAFSANLQAKICAIAVARSLMDLPPEPTTLANTCYSFIAPDEAVSISAVYRNAGGALQSVDGAGGTTPLSATAAVRQTEAAQARDWFRAITAEAFG